MYVKERTAINARHTRLIACLAAGRVTIPGIVRLYRRFCLSAMQATYSNNKIIWSQSWPMVGILLVGSSCTGRHSNDTYSLPRRLSLVTRFSHVGGGGGGNAWQAEERLRGRLNCLTSAINIDTPEEILGASGSLENTELKNKGTMQNI